MSRVIKRIFVIPVIVGLLLSSIVSRAASGPCEIFYFTYSGSVGAGGSAAIESYLNNMGYSASRYANTHAYYVRRTMDNDKVFAIVSHGMPGRVVCKDGVTTVSANAVSSDNNNYSLAACFSSGAFSNMKFAYYGACRSANTSGTYGNLITYSTGTLGAASALGFSNDIYTNKAAWYEEKLFMYLNNGFSVLSANSLAQLSTYNQYGTYGGVDSAVVSGTIGTTIN